MVDSSDARTEAVMVLAAFKDYLHQTESLASPLIDSQLETICKDIRDASSQFPPLELAFFKIPPLYSDLFDCFMMGYHKMQSDTIIELINQESYRKAYQAGYHASGHIQERLKQPIPIEFFSTPPKAVPINHYRPA